jgi:hypothetical protein
MTKEKIKIMRVGVLPIAAESDYAAAFGSGYRHFLQYIDVNQGYV